MCSGLTSISLPAGITSIGESAFAYSGLTSISLPVSLTEIWDNTFEGCDSLKPPAIPVGVTVHNSGT
jgi:hypothetical protein